MSSEGYWEKLREIFSEIVEQPLAERASLLESRCGNDSALRERLERLLEADDRSRDLVGEAVDDAISAAELEAATQWIGRAIGPYRVQALIASGGMGAVYLGERQDEAFSKQVAIKVVRGGLDSPELLERFRAERRILARLEHPHIARILDGGSTEDDLPFLVMEYVDGLDITAYCREHALSLDRRISLFLGVCEAVDHAHRNLVVHRDLKPSNILVDPRGTPRLLDFGIAKLLDPDGDEAPRTQFRFLTPVHASPEQIRGEAYGTATDIYSLGSVLYAMLVGREAFADEKGDPLALQQAVLNRAPPPPSQAAADPTLSRALAGDLDTILLTALRKEPERRYPSVAALAADLERFRAGLPIEARPTTRRYRLGKFLRRHRRGATAAVLGLLLLLAGSIISTTLFIKAEREQHTAAQIGTMLQDVLTSVDPRVARGEDITLMRHVLGRASERVEQELANRPGVAASLHGTLGDAYLSIARFEEAEHHQRAALALYDELDLGRSIKAAKQSRGLAMALEAKGQYTKADSTVTATIEALRTAGSPKALASTLRVAAAIALARGEQPAAEAALVESLALEREAGGETAGLGASLSHLGAFYLGPTTWDADRAEPLLRESLALWDRLGDEHRLDRAVTAKQLGLLLSFDERGEEAESLYREALIDERELYGRRHPEPAITLNGLARIMESRGDFPAAEEFYRDALRVQELALGPEHTDLGTTCNNLAGVLRKTGRFDQANELYLRAVDIYRASRGADDAWVGIALGSLALTLEWSGNWAEAERAAEECLRIRNQVWGPEHWRSAVVESVRGACLAARGEFTEAENLLLASAVILERESGPDHLNTRQNLVRLARLYAITGRPEKAETLRAKLLGDEFPDGAAMIPALSDD